MGQAAPGHGAAPAPAPRAGTPCWPCSADDGPYSHKTATTAVFADHSSSALCCAFERCRLSDPDAYPKCYTGRLCCHPSINADAAPDMHSVSVHPNKDNGGKHEDSTYKVYAESEASDASGKDDEIHEDELMLDVTHPSYQEVVVAEGTYKGQVRKNTQIFEGFGCLRCAEWAANGEWRDGRLHGDGCQKWSDGRVYQGQFYDGCFSGHGRMLWKHPHGTMVYEGQYLNDKKHGLGKFTWPSGKTYEGQWVCGQRHGIGVDTSGNDFKVRGVWEDNVFMGYQDAEGGDGTEQAA